MKRMEGEGGGRGAATGDTQLLFLGVGGGNRTSKCTLRNRAQPPPPKIEIFGGVLGMLQGTITIGVIL
jgi:hypothetical protein